MFGIANATATFIFIPQINSSRTAASDMLQVSELPPALREGSGDHRLSHLFPVELKDLDFRYPSRPDQQVLSSIDLTIRPGACIALVGPSGSGKSTIASLLSGLYQPSATSTITFNNLAISICNISSLRAQLSIVPQQPYLFPTTILANIIYGLPEDHPLATLAQAIDAAKDVGLHDFIMSFDSGYLTLIGEGGIGLSGGQIQRVAIARALVRKPKILVLDEATSSLDAISAETVRQIIGKFLDEGRTQREARCVVTITHGIEMMKMVDEVCMLEDGRIVEKGTFEDLIRQGGRFCALVGKLNQVHKM
jgi:ATP-binding cassette subfamily B (MDR/TAP) protein 1